MDNNNLSSARPNDCTAIPYVPWCTIVSAALLLMLSHGETWAAAAQVVESRAWLGSRHTRLVFDVSAPVSHKLFALSGPDRLVLDVANARLAQPLRPHDFKGSLLAGMRTSSRGNDLRIVLDLSRQVMPEAAVMKSGAAGGYQLVVDLYDSRGKPPPTLPPELKTAAKPAPVMAPELKTVAKPGPVESPELKTATKPAPAETPPQKMAKTDLPAAGDRPTAADPAPHGRAAEAAPETPVPAARAVQVASTAPTPLAVEHQPPTTKPAARTVERPAERTASARSARGGEGHAKTPSKAAVAAPPQAVVVIDPGHGGKDPGAMGPSGVREKDVTLAIARKLARLVDKEPGMRAVLTRNGDLYLPLRTRMNKARQHKADLFISIHADAFRETDARGSSVFVLSERGASSEAARWLAERENAADLIGGVSLDDKDRMLASVLLDLSQTAAIEESMDVADQVLGSLRRVGSVHHQDVQFAGFAVLKSPDVPSILIETAFLTNPDEERKLRDAKHQAQLAEAMMRGIRAYFAKRLPARTVLAERTDRIAAAPDDAGMLQQVSLD